MNTRATEAHAIAEASPVAHAEHVRASHHEHAPGKSGSAVFAQILGQKVAASDPTQTSEAESKKLPGLPELPNVRATSMTTPEPRGPTSLAMTDTLDTGIPPARIFHEKDVPGGKQTEANTTNQPAKGPAVKVTHSATALSPSAPDIRRFPREFASPVPKATETSKPPAETKVPTPSEQPVLREKRSPSTPHPPQPEQGSVINRETSNGDDRPAVRLAARGESRTETPHAAARASTDKPATKPASEALVPPASPSRDAPNTLDTPDLKPVIHSSAKEQVVAGRPTVKASALDSASPSTASTTVEPRLPKVAPHPVATARPGTTPDVTTAAANASSDVPPTHLQAPVHDSDASPKATTHPPDSRAHVLYAQARTVTPTTFAPDGNTTMANARAVAEDVPLTTNAQHAREPNNDSNVTKPHTKAGPAVPASHTPRTSTLPLGAVPTAVATSAPILSPTQATIPSPTAPSNEKPAPGARHPSKDSNERTVANTTAAPILPTTLSPPVPIPNGASTTQDHSATAATVDGPKAEPFSQNTAPVAKPAIVDHAPASTNHSPRKPTSVPADAAATAPSAQPLPVAVAAATPPPAKAAEPPPRGETSPVAAATPTRPSIARPKQAATIADQSSIAVGSSEKPSSESAEPSPSPSAPAPALPPPTPISPTTANAISAAGPQGAPSRAKNESIQPKKRIAETGRDIEDRSDGRSEVDDGDAAPAQAFRLAVEPTATAPSAGAPPVEPKVVKAAERPASETPDLSTSASSKPHSPAPTPDLLAGQNTARLVPPPMVEKPATVGTAIPPQTVVSASTVDGPAFSAAEQTSKLVDRAIDDPGLSVAVMPHAAHMSITSTTGDLALHVRVRDGSADVNVSGSLAPLFDSKAPEVRTVLAGEGLSLGSFATDQRGQSQHHQQPSEPGARPDSHPTLPKPRHTSSVTSDTDISDDHRIHVTA